MSDAIYRSSWREDTRLTPRSKAKPPKAKRCPRCGTYSHRLIGDPCPYCYYLDSFEQRQYYAYKRWHSDKEQEQRDDAELNRILER